MGVPGLWRVLNMAAQPINLENFSGLKIALDIHSHLNKILHGGNANNWLFFLMKDLFQILHYNIKIVVVFQGRQFKKKTFSGNLFDESSVASYHRVRSALLRASAAKLEQNAPIAQDLPKPTIEIQPEKIKESPKREILPQSDPLTYSMAQLDRVAKSQGPKPQALLVRSDITTPFIYLNEKNSPKRSTENSPQKGSPKFSKAKESTEFTTDFLEEMKDLLEDPESEKLDEAVEPEKKDDMLPVSLLPADNPYLAPIENYVTGEHVRLARELLDLLGIPYIQASEESTAECARLEMAGSVNAAATDDNNFFLFGGRWMIRSIWTRPISITLGSLEKHGITRKRLLNLAMMIDGDYNNDIRQRLFTVGPIRGLEILARFPDPDLGLLQFKEWWLRVVKGKCEEKNLDLKRFAKSKWLNRLVVPATFPPMDLYNGFLKPDVLSNDVDAKSPQMKGKEVIEFMSKSCAMRTTRIEEIVRAFDEQSKKFNNQPPSIRCFALNNAIVPTKIMELLTCMENFDKGMKAPQLDFFADIEEEDDLDSIFNEAFLEKGAPEMSDQNGGENDDEFEDVDEISDNDKKSQTKEEESDDEEIESIEDDEDSIVED